MSDEATARVIRKVEKAERRRRKKARKVIGKMQSNAIRWRLMEHLHEATGMAPSNAAILSDMILADIRPMIEAELAEGRGDDGN